MNEQKINDDSHSQPFKPQVIKLSRRHHRSYRTQHQLKNKIHNPTIIHVKLRSRTISIPLSHNQLTKIKHDMHSIPTVPKKRHHKNVSKKLSIPYKKNATHPTNVSNIHSSQSSLPHSSQNSWHNDDSLESLQRTTYVKARKESPTTTILDNERCEDNKKNKTKFSRACIITIVVAAILLVIVATVIPVVLLNFSKANTVTINKTAVLRWNSTGVTVAGVTGQIGNASNKLYVPVGLALDYSNSLYISDALNNRIQKYLMGSSFGTTVAGQVDGTHGSTSMYLYTPTDVAIDAYSNVYVVDTTNNRVQFWSNDSLSVKTIDGNGTAAKTNTQLNQPYGIFRDSDSGTLYISDTYNDRIMCYLPGASMGTVVAGGNASGLSNTYLTTPYGIHYDSPSNSLIIANGGTHNIVRWVIGASSWSTIAGNASGYSGASSTELNGPFDVTLDPMGNVYVADRLNYRIQFFLAGQSYGKTIAGITGIFGTNSSLFIQPMSVVLDSQLNLYVADAYNYRVQKFQRY